ncbi:MAG TPA: LD-carboxypeptidase [Firmicutes bacterium]|nr:LD-carboxypeptidase [Candidatus Fermentithermobacillaceae bacterium]
MNTDPVKPQALKQGDTVAIVAPSGVAGRRSLERGIRFFESLGLQVKVGPSVMHRWGYLAGSDEERARDIMTAWADPEVKAVIAARGGYGAMRILSYLDFDCIRENPKILLGYSDITALHLAFWKEAGLTTFHGPVAEIWAPEMGKYNRRMLTETLFGLWPSGDLHMPAVEENVPGKGDEEDAFGGAGGQKPRKCAPTSQKLVALEPGEAQGRLIGGNLSLIASTIGTAWEIDTRGKVLFLEEVGEKPYRVDRMLCQLELSGKLSDAAGFCVGGFTGCEADPERPSFTVDEVLEQYFTGTGKPCITNVPAGHGKFNATLPLGAKVHIEVSSDGSRPPRICFPENALCRHIT